MGNVYNKIGYSPEAAANFDGIFRRPKTEHNVHKLECTKGKSFCQLHQGDCEKHFFLMGDGRCTCQPCETSTLTPPA